MPEDGNKCCKKFKDFHISRSWESDNSLAQVVPPSAKKRGTVFEEPLWGLWATYTMYGYAVLRNL